MCLTWQGTVLEGVVHITREIALTFAKQKSIEVSWGVAISAEGRRLSSAMLCPKIIIKDKHLCCIFSDLEHAGKLAWLVIDEAHCVLQDGHDF